MKQLLSYETAEVNAIDEYILTLLHDAIEYCRSNCVEDLLTQKDIHIHIQDEKGRSTLEIAGLLIVASSHENYFEYKRKFESIFTVIRNIESSNQKEFPAMPQLYIL